MWFRRDANLAKTANEKPSRPAKKAKLGQNFLTDASGALIPELATSWDTSSDGKVFTFHLRTASWQDGTPFTAQEEVTTAARLLGMAAKLLGQPPVLGEILAGILLGPTFFHGTITKALFPTSLIPPLTALADIGLVLFMFVVGYEVDLRLIRGRERVAVGVSVGSVILPLGLGTALGVWLAHRNHLHNVSSFALFIGTAMAATAFPVLARILTDRGLHRTRIGGIALASAAIADVLAWTLLAVVVALAGSSAQWKVLLAIPYAAAMFGIVRPLLRRLSRFYLQAGRLTPNILATVLAGLLLSCYATNWMGLHFIFGAFLFGVIMPRENVLGLREEILERLEQVSVLVLLPIYFVVSGLSINLSTIGSSGLEELGQVGGTAFPDNGRLQVLLLTEPRGKITVAPRVLRIVAKPRCSFLIGPERAISGQASPQWNTREMRGHQRFTLDEGTGVEAVDQEDIVLDRRILDRQAERLGRVARVRHRPQKVTGNRRCCSRSRTNGFLQLQTIARPQVFRRQALSPAAADCQRCSGAIDAPTAVDAKADSAYAMGACPAGAGKLTQQLRQPIAIVRLARMLLVERQILWRTIGAGEREPGRRTGGSDDDA